MECKKTLGMSACGYIFRIQSFRGEFHPFHMTNFLHFGDWKKLSQVAIIIIDIETTNSRVHQETWK